MQVEPFLEAQYTCIHTGKEGGKGGKKEWMEGGRQGSRQAGRKEAIAWELSAIALVALGHWRSPEHYLVNPSFHLLFTITRI